MNLSNKITIDNAAIMSIMVYVITFTMCFGYTKAYDISIDWPTSTTKESILAITVNKCETRFTIKNGDLVRFEQSTKDLDEVLKIAIKRYEDGCKE